MIPWIGVLQVSLSFTISWSLLKLMSIESVMSSNHLILCLPFLLLPSHFPSIKVQMSQLFVSGSQCIEASALVLPMDIQGWFPLGLNGLISLHSKRFSRVITSTTIRKHQFFSAQSSLWSNCHIYTWLLEKPQLWVYRLLLANSCFYFLIHSLGF